MKLKECLNYLQTYYHQTDALRRHWIVLDRRLETRYSDVEFKSLEELGYQIADSDRKKWGHMQQRLDILRKSKRPMIKLEPKQEGANYEQWYPRTKKRLIQTRIRLEQPKTKDGNQSTRGQNISDEVCN